MCATGGAPHIGLGFHGFRCDAAYQLPTEFWRQLSGRVRQVPILADEGRIDRLDHPGPAILVPRKHAINGPGQALLIMNKNPWTRGRSYADDLSRLSQTTLPLRDVSPDWPMAELPTPFEFWLGPGMARVLVVDDA
jgi:starch synthase (maltosyl-transferring)